MALSPEDAVERARLIAAIADPTRMRIIDLLRDYAGEVTVGEMTPSCQLSQPTISHHLRILRSAGVIDYRKRGYYYVNWERVEEALRAIKELEQ